MNLMILGLTFNLFGSIFLGLYIIGEKRLKKFESAIKKLPKILIEKFHSMFLNNIIQIIIHRSKNVQSNLEYIIKLFSRQKNKNLKEITDQKAKKILNSYGWFLIILEAILYTILSPILIPIYVLITPFRIVQEKFHLKSLFGIIGIFILFLGYLFQLIALFIY